MRGWALLGWLACGCGATTASLPGVVPSRQSTGVACPLDHTPVEVPWVLLGQQTGVRFDLRPTGSGTLLPPLARCGRCGLAFEPEREELEKLVEPLRAAVASPGYQAERTNPSDRYLWALALEGAGALAERRARAWLEASWELEGVDEPRRRDSLERALAAYRKVAATPPREGDWISRISFSITGPPEDEDLARTAELIQVELLRQLSRFDEAAAALEALVPRPEFNRTAYVQLVPLERALLAARDPRPRPIPLLGPIDWNDDSPEVLEARALRGWATASLEFVITSAHRGTVNFGPEALTLDLQARGSRSIDEARWSNLLDKLDRPRFTWGDFLEAFRAGERAVGRHPWLLTWRRADARRRLELRATGAEPWDAADRFGYGHGALGWWRRAGLPGAPAAELQVRTGGGDACAHVYLDSVGELSLVLNEPGCAGSDWPGPVRSPPGSFLLVRPDGRWEQLGPPGAVPR